MSTGTTWAGPEGQDLDKSIAGEFAAAHPWAGPLTRLGPDQGTAPVLATIVPVRRPFAGPVRYVMLLLEPESSLWPLLTGVLDGWLVLHATRRVPFASEHATWLLGVSTPTRGR